MMGTVMPYDEFIARRFPKTDDDLVLAEKGEAKPMPDMEGYNEAVKNLQNLGVGMMSKLVDVLMILADTQPGKTTPVTYDTYQELLKLGLPNNRVLNLRTNEHGIRIVDITKKDLEIVSHKLALGGESA